MSNWSCLWPRATIVLLVFRDSYSSSHIDNAVGATIQLRQEEYEDSQ
jgi:hypothetical protein